MANPRGSWVPNRPNRARSNPASNRSMNQGPVSKVRQYIEAPTEPAGSKYKNEIMFPKTYLTDTDLEEKNMAESIIDEYKDDPTLKELLNEIDNCFGAFRKDNDGLIELRSSLANTKKNLAQANKVANGLQKTVKTMTAK